MRTLTELLDDVSLEGDIRSRAMLINIHAALIPAFRLYLKLCFAPDRSFEFITQGKPFEPQPIAALDNIDWERVIHEIYGYADPANKMKPTIKRSKVIQLLDCVGKEDALLLRDMLYAKYSYNDKINALVVRQAFPELFDSKNP